MPTKTRRFFEALLAVLSLALSDSAAADNQQATAGEARQKARIYRSPEERREAGFGREINDWLKLSGLVEIETESVKPILVEPSFTTTERNTAINGQLAFELSLSEFASAEITIEVEEDEGTRTVLDEAVLILDFEPLEIELGRLSVPFGEYYSHFISGPILEFGETLTEGIVLGYAPNDNIEVSLYAFDNQIRALGDDGNPDWGFNLELINNTETVKVGLGYLSDLAESDEQIFADVEGALQKQIGAWNAYALFGFEKMELTAEFVSAAGELKDLDAEFSRPRAYNIEVAFFTSDTTQFSLRYERSEQVEDSPKSQYGANFTWRPKQYLLLSAEYLRGKFSPEFAFDDDDRELRKSDTIAVQLAVEF